MTDQQLYFAVGIPVLATLAALAANIALYVHLSGRVDTVSARFDPLRKEVTEHMDRRFDSLERLFDSKLARVEEVLDARLKHLEER